MLGELKEECGIFGISLKESSFDLIKNLYLGLFALQHRGQESCGIAFKNDNSIELLIRQGLVSDNFFKSLPLNLKVPVGIGHVRYSTFGASNLVNAQPFVFNCNKGEIAIAHNGNIPDAEEIRGELIEKGSIFQTTSDSEILIHLLAQISKEDFRSSLISSLNHLNGAYSFLLLYKDYLIAIRDKFGFRPLCYGKTDNGIVFTSETNALDLIGAKFINEVNPGEIIFCKNGEITEKVEFTDSDKKRQCVFELIYFSRPDSIVFGESVHEVRIKMGEKLALACKINPDIVIPVPDSGNSAALGFSRAIGKPFEFGLIRNHYTGRTFIKPGQDIRKESVKVKLNPIKSVINNKSIAVIDDSLVRGTTSSKIVRMLKEAGAREVHMFLSSPEIKYSCFYGINTPTREELISANHSREKIAEMIGADSVNFLKIEDLRECLEKPDNYCYACFKGKYAIKSNYQENKSYINI